MVNGVIYIEPEDIEVITEEGYSFDVAEQFSSKTDSAKTWVKYAKVAKDKVEKILYATPAFIDMLKKAVPDELLKAVLTDEQKKQIADGALKLMTKKDGTLLATLIEPETKKIIAKVPLEKMQAAPSLAEAMTNYMTQMQMAQIAEQIQAVQGAIEEVRQGQEYDRLAMAYSCQQKLLQAMRITKPELKERALLHIASSAEDSRNLLMQSQNANLRFIKEQPEDFWGKVFSGAKPEKIEQRLNEIRDGLSAVNMVSLAEAMAYQEMGETAAASQSLLYYAEYIDRAYLSDSKLVERLDQIDSSPEKYWSKTLPEIKQKIQALPYAEDISLLEVDLYGNQEM